MEYVLGPLIALIVSLKYSQIKSNKSSAIDNELKLRIEMIEKRYQIQEQELPKKMIAVMTPVTQAVAKLNEQVGMQ